MELVRFFQENPRTAVAFSGGVDSAYLLYAGSCWGEAVKAYYVKSPFQPAFELEDACRLAQMLGVEMEVIPLDTLSIPEIQKNAPDRCYYCKKAIFSAIWQAARADGFSVLLDGSNASDDPADRPGMLALTQLQVRSPLRECGLTKNEIRELSREAGLFTHDKPAYACLATRIPVGMPVTGDKLAITERAESFLSQLGLWDFRVRLTENGEAKIQARAEDLPMIVEKREEIRQTLGRDYAGVILDLEVRDEH